MLQVDPKQLAVFHDRLTELIHALESLASSPIKVPSRIEHVISLDLSVLWLAVGASFLAATTFFFFLVLLWRKK